VNFRDPQDADADGLKQLEKMEKVQHTYILWITGGTPSRSPRRSSVRREALPHRRHRQGAPPEAKEEEKKDGQARDDGKRKRKG